MATTRRADMFTEDGKPSDDDQREHRKRLGEVLVGMVEEYARHTGHVDLLRERIDGRIGQ